MRRMGNLLGELLELVHTAARSHPRLPPPAQPDHQALVPFSPPSSRLLRAEHGVQGEAQLAPLTLALGAPIQLAHAVSSKGPYRSVPVASERALVESM